MAKPKAKILIVEDDKFLVKAYQIKLNHEGYKILVASDGVAGMDLAKKEKPSVIILDLMLPKMDGFKFLKSIKEDEQAKGIPILVLSNLGQKGDVDKAISLGAKEYFVKTDFSLEEIVKKIKEYAG